MLEAHFHTSTELTYLTLQNGLEQIGCLLEQVFTLTQKQSFIFVLTFVRFFFFKNKRNIRRGLVYGCFSG